MKKLSLISALLALLFLAGYALSGSLFNHTLPGGELVDAVALEDGAAVTLTREWQSGNDILTLAYLDAQGRIMETYAWPLGYQPELLIVQVCGAYLQLFTGYEGFAERVVYELPAAQTTCQEKTYLPLIDNTP